MATVGDVMAALARIAPPELAMPGDPIGLHAGDPEGTVRRVLVALDATLAALEEAKRAKADMLVVHHPRFFRGLSTLAESDADGARAAAIARSGLAVFSAHTNLDIAPGGTNDLLAEAAGIVQPAVLRKEGEERLVKLAVFVPTSHTEKVRKAVCAAGAGAIGNYSDCTFRVLGTGSFRGGAATRPFLGKPGILEEADEYRLETVFGEFSTDAVLAAMRAAHPYEEVAYDLYPMLGRGKPYGLGRVGALAKKESLAALARRMAALTGSRMAQFCGKGSATVTRAAVWAGEGAPVRAVVASGADVLITGELGYHAVEAFHDKGVSVVTLGHGHSETLVLKPLAAALRRMVPGVETTVSRKGLIVYENAV